MSTDGYRDAAIEGGDDNRVTDPEHAQYLARLNVMNTEATYNAVVNLAEQVLAGEVTRKVEEKRGA